MSFELYYSHPEKGPQIIPLDQPILKIGSLLSNQGVVEGEGVEPIHAVIEEREGTWYVRDLSDSGITLNAKKLDAALKPGDSIGLGKVNLVFRKVEVPIELPPDIPKDIPEEVLEEIPKDIPLPDLSKLPYDGKMERRAKGSLFSPRTAQSLGDVLEVVAYWHNQVLEVEQFHPSFKDFSKVFIGDPTKTHFLAAGDKTISRFLFAEAGQNGYTLNLLEGMTARVRGIDSVRELTAGSYKLTKKDIAHVRYGPVHYFLNFMKPPKLELPPEGLKDPFLFGLTTVTLVLYFAIALALGFSNPSKKDEKNEDIWAVVHTGKVEEVLKPESKPETVVEEVQTPPPIAQEEEAKKVEPAPAQEPEKPKPEPKPEPRQVETLTKSKTQVEKPAPKEKPTQFGNEQKGAPREGVDATNVKGSEADNKKPSAPNLSKLGIGVGKIASTGGAGAIHTNFKNSPGGAGGGTGTAPKTLGLGGLQAGKSLGIAGAANAVNQFGGAKMVNENDAAKSFKGAREAVNVNVNVRAADPLISGGLSQEEIQTVIDSNKNQIAHCYRRLLQKEPGAAGRVSVRFTIGSSGSVSKIEIERSTFTDQEIGTCIMGVVKRFKFAAPKGGQDVKVSYPFMFNPVS